MAGGVIASFLLLAAAWSVASPDWMDCPAACRCKWSSGKKSAFCRDAGFTTVPILNADMQVLDLTGNLIPYLTKDTFKSIGLLNLQRIFLRHTALREIHPDAFRNLSILVEIDLSENKIEKIHPDTFLGNDRLRFLNLSGNPLTELVSSQFPVLRYLKTIELQNCNLKSIHRDAFVNLPLLETLSLNSNHLSNISETVFKSIVKLKTLRLDNNPWKCDCGLRDFRNWLLQSNLYSVPLTCAEPLPLAGLHWNDVPMVEFACGPTVTITETMIQEEVGGNVTFKCYVTGDPEPEVVWLFNGKPMNVSMGDQVYLEEEVGLRKWVLLSLYNVSEMDAGEYSCHAKNLRGSVITNATLMLPEVVTATTLSKTESWLLIAEPPPPPAPNPLPKFSQKKISGLVAGGVATFFSVTVAIICTVCLCGRKRRRKRYRRKAKLKGSVSFTEQEKKLLDVSITTTERQSNAESVEQLNQPEMEMLESASIPLELCEPVHITIESHGANTGGLMPLSVPLTVFPPPPEFSSSVLPTGAYGNIFISVSVSQEPSSDGIVRYPDLLDIPHRAKNASARVSVGAGPEAALPTSQSFATFPRRPRPKSAESTDPQLRVGPIYDNMGPRVTAGGSSTLSLPEVEETDIPPPPPPPPPPPLCLPLSVDYISL